MENKFTISVIVITRNEADRLDRCLASIKNLADEIIIYDSGSQDNTLEIAARYTHKIFQTDWPGYGIQKQRHCPVPGVNGCCPLMRMRWSPLNLPGRSLRY